MCRLADIPDAPGTIARKIFSCATPLRATREISSRRAYETRAKLPEILSESITRDIPWHFIGIKEWDIDTAELGRNGGYPNPLVADCFTGVVLLGLVDRGWLAPRWRHPWYTLCNPPSVAHRNIRISRGSNQANNVDLRGFSLFAIGQLSIRNLHRYVLTRSKDLVNVDFALQKGVIDLIWLIELLS